MDKNRFLCGYCDKYFSQPGEAGCGSCSHSIGCKKVKCPYCGYDNPPVEEMPAWFKKIGQYFSKGKGAK